MPLLMLIRISTRETCNLKIKHVSFPYHLVKQMTELSLHFGKEIEELEITRLMKRYGNLFEKIIDINNIKLAHKNAKIGKKDTEIIEEIDKNLSYYCNLIHDMLLNKTYTTSDYEIFMLNDSGKDRQIYKLPYFPDRIIQHAIMQILEPIWKPTLIADTYQAIRGRGVHKCVKKARHVIQDEYKDVDNLYCLQIDVKKFYPSIKNWLLKDVVRNKIKCKDTLWLLDDIIDSCDEVPIGNYISQYLGNLSLSSIDHIMKEECGVKNYFRYCDDIVIIHTDKKVLTTYRDRIRMELICKDLKMKENFQIYEICKRRGVDFLGFSIYRNKMLLRRKIANNFKKIAKTGGLEKVYSMISYYGWLNFCDGRNLWLKYVDIYLKTLTKEEMKDKMIKTLLARVNQNKI